VGELGAMAAKAVEGTGLDEPFNGGTVYQARVGAVAEVKEVLEGPTLLRASTMASVACQPQPLMAARPKTTRP
jgi:hypothetical protein